MFIKKTILEILSIADTLSKIGKIKKISSSKIWDIIEILDIADEVVKRWQKIRAEKIEEKKGDTQAINKELNELLMKEVEIPKKNTQFTIEELQEWDLSVNEIRQIKDIFVIKRDEADNNV